MGGRNKSFILYYTKQSLAQNLNAIKVYSVLFITMKWREGMLKRILKWHQE